MGILWQFVTLLNLLLGNNNSSGTTCFREIDNGASSYPRLKLLAMDGDGNGAPGVAVAYRSLPVGRR